MTYQWYPGHMTKAMRMMQEDIKLIDIVIEILDARIPISSQNPDIDRLAAGKSRLILLNKSDLADKRINEEWVRYFKNKGIECVLINSQKGMGLKDIKNSIMLCCREKLERDKRRGIINRPIRAMVCGIPNVGKSTFINSFTKKSCVKTGNKPGVTKGKQWIRMDNSLELLDTPGVLWPKFQDERVGLHLAMIGSINDEIIHENELAADILEFLLNNIPGRIYERYGVLEKTEKFELLEDIGRKKQCLIKGGEVDIKKTSVLITDDFRSGKLGLITIERPCDYE